MVLEEINEKKCLISDKSSVPSAGQKFRVVFNDGTEVVRDRFTIACTVGRFIKDIKENLDGTIEYKGDLFSFKAYPLDKE